MLTCALDSCERLASRDAGGRRGYCSTHYSRLRKHGDVMVDKRIKYDRVGFSNRRVGGLPWHHLSRYGLWPDQFAALVEAQGGKCGLCGRTRKLCVDHDHKTGKVRGLLCRACNTAIGQFDDDPEKLLAAVEWVRSDHADVLP